MNDELAGERYAGFVKRVLAFALDYLLIAGYLIVLAGVGAGLTLALGPPERTSPLFASPVVMDLIVFLIAVLPVILYFTFRESAPAQATWGKRRVGLKVVDGQGNRLSRPRAFVRSLLKFLPWQVAHTSLFHIEGWPFAPTTPTPVVTAGLILAQILVVVYLLSLAVGRKHRTPYDWAAGSFVIVAGRSTEGAQGR